MNCEQANKISIKKVLNSFSLFPSKESSIKAFYYAIDRKENTPSLHVDFRRNTAYDYGTGKIYDVVSIVQTINQCSVSEALHYLSQCNHSFPTKESIAYKKEKKSERSYSSPEVKAISHPDLIRYLKSRKLKNYIKHLKEIHYTIAGRPYYGIAFKNDSKGYEVRNKYRGLCLGKKDVTTVRNNCKVVRIFEGFLDYLSFLSISELLESKPSDYIILNSVAMADRIESSIKEYKKIELYLDNDTAGNNATEKIKSQHFNVSDNRLLYSNHKDLNDFINRK